MPRSRLALVVLLCGCAGQPVDTLTVTASDATQFTARFQTTGGPGLVVTVLFTDDRSLVGIATDGGETLALADTAADLHELPDPLAQRRRLLRLRR